MINRNTVEIWRGPSRIDGSPIVVLAAGFLRRSKNAKTGAMVQTYILRADVDPMTAINTGADISICGDCKHRNADRKRRTCYVDVSKSVRSVWLSWHGGRVQSTDLDTAAQRARGRAVRLGAYGDPAAVPSDVWIALLRYATRHTGYTHQWRNVGADYRAILVASVDTLAEYGAAKADNWRTFRVRAGGERSAEREISCPASSEAGKRTTCERCSLCDGSRGTADSRRDIVINAHGAVASKIIRLTAV